MLRHSSETHKEASAAKQHMQGKQHKQDSKLSCEAGQTSRQTGASWSLLSI